MATIKSYTDISQSKKLAEILPINSADMYYPIEGAFPKFGVALSISTNIPCWTLAALLSALPPKCDPIKDHETNLILGKPKDKWCALYWDATGMQDGEQTLADNPVDACYNMIIKLHELNLL